MGGGQAEDAVAGEDFVAVEPALGDFESVDQVPKSALSRRFFQGVEVVNFADDAGCGDVGDGKWNKRIAHPKSECLGLTEDEEHSCAVGQFSPAHQPDGAFIGLVGHFRSDRVCPDLERDGRQGSLWRGAGQADGGAKVKAPNQSECQGGSTFPSGQKRGGLWSSHGMTNSACGLVRTFFSSECDPHCY